MHEILVETLKEMGIYEEVVELFSGDTESIDSFLDMFDDLAGYIIKGQDCWHECPGVPGLITWTKIFLRLQNPGNTRRMPQKVVCAQ
jgi:hypothetical protein